MGLLKEKRFFCCIKMLAIFFLTTGKSVRFKLYPILLYSFAHMRDAIIRQLKTDFQTPEGSHGPAV